jgi:hypothetical protein
MGGTLPVPVKKNGSQLLVRAVFFARMVQVTGVGTPVSVVLFSVGCETFPDFLSRLEFPLRPRTLR